MDLGQCQAGCLGDLGVTERAELDEVAGCFARSLPMAFCTGGWLRGLLILRRVSDVGKPGVAVGAEQELIGEFFELTGIADAGQQGLALLGNLGAKAAAG